MYLRYVLTVSYDDIYVYERAFKSLNQVIKVAAGFNYDSNTGISMYIVDDVTDRIISFNNIKKMIKELCYD